MMTERMQYVAAVLACTPSHDAGFVEGIPPRCELVGGERAIVASPLAN